MEMYLYSRVPTLFGDHPAPLEVHLVGHEYVGAAVAAVLAGEVLQRLARILEQSFKRGSAKISQSRRWPLLQSSLELKCLLALSHLGLRHYAKQV